ncbi:MAG: ferredoxin [Gemmatimonadetes bacterium]|nr:ferredoxin [Gemmatimonadota bacterium]
MEAEFERRMAALQAEHEARLAELKATYPAVVARRLAEGLLKSPDGRQFAGALMKAMPGAMNGNGTSGGAVTNGANTPVVAPATPAPATPAPATTAPQASAVNVAGTSAAPSPVAAIAPAAAAKAVVAPVAAAAPAAAAPAQPAAPATAAAPDGDDLAMDPYVESARCTSCNECTNLNKRLFAYNASKQAYVKDPAAGTFAQLVQAAEKCPVSAIHPGTPRNPKEKDLAKWIERAKPFN